MSETYCVKQVSANIKYQTIPESLPHLYAIQSCTARRVTRLVATLTELLGDRVGTLVAL